MATIGAQLPQPDPRGWLTFDELPDALRKAEDSTQAADHARTKSGWGRKFERESTTAERTLLIHLGHELPEELKTVVMFLSFSVRNRRWPQLETTQEVTP